MKYFYTFPHIELHVNFFSSNMSIMTWLKNRGMIFVLCPVSNERAPLIPTLSPPSHKASSFCHCCCFVRHCPAATFHPFYEGGFQWKGGCNHHPTHPKSIPKGWNFQQNSTTFFCCPDAFHVSVQVETYFQVMSKGQNWNTGWNLRAHCSDCFNKFNPSFKANINRRHSVLTVLRSLTHHSHII